jgi:hypothetical protein
MIFETVGACSGEETDDSCLTNQTLRMDLLKGNFGSGIEIAIVPAGAEE